MMRISWTLRGRIQYILARGLLQKNFKKRKKKKKVFFLQRRKVKKKSFVNNFLEVKIFKKKEGKVFEKKLKKKLKREIQKEDER